MTKDFDSVVDEEIMDISSEAMLAMYVTMQRIRRFEEKVSDLLESGVIKCPSHLCIGQEAIAAGVCENLRKEDYIFSTHRNHGHYMAKGGSLELLMAELYGRSTGCSRGKGGSMLTMAPEVGILGSCSIVAGNIPLAVGAALASSIRGNDSVAVAFFGDGATEEGAFHESLNFASLKKLPVIFICENNLYSAHLRLCYRQPGNNIYQKAEGYLMPGVQVDGNNVTEVFRASRKAIENARDGKGPTLIECMTYRWRAHVGPWRDLDLPIRTKEEVFEWMERCPIKAAEALLLEQGDLSEPEKENILKQIDTEVEKAVAFAEEGSPPDKSELTKDVFKI